MSFRDIFDEHFDTNLDIIQQVAGVGATAIGLAPVAGAAWYMTQNNRGFSTTELLGGRGLLSKVAEKAATGSKHDYTTRRVEEIMSGDSVSKLLGDVEQRRAMIQTLLTSLDDPEFGINEAQAQQWKTSLMSILDLDTNTVPKDIREVITSMVSTISETQSTEAKSRFNQNLRDNLSVRHSIVAPPATNPFAGQRFSTQIFASDLQGGASKKYTQLTKAWDARHIKLRKIDSGPGAGSVIAQVFDTHGGWRTNVPLDMTDNVFFAGQDLNTRYRTPQMVLSLDAAKQVSSQRLSHDEAARRMRRGTPGFMSYSDWAFNEFTERIDPSRLSIRGVNDYRRLQTQIALQDEAPLYGAPIGMEQDPLYQSIDRQQKSSSNYVAITGLEQAKKREQLGIIQGFTHESWDLGLAADESIRHDYVRNQAFGKVGIKRGSAYEGFSVPPGFQKDPTTVSLHARVPQVTGRTRIFTGDTFVAKSGAKFGPGAPVLEFSKDTVTGGSAKFMVIDLDNAYNLADSGQVVTLGTERIREVGSKPLMDPTKHGYATSKLVSRLMGLKAGESIELTPDEVMSKGYGYGYLGEGPGGKQFLPRPPDASGYRVWLEPTLESHGKFQMRLKYEVQRDIKEGAKLFGMTAKATTSRAGSSDRFFEMLGHLGLNGKRLSELGFDKASAGQHIGITPGDMLSKHQLSVPQMMLGGMYALTGDENIYDTVGENIRTMGAKGSPLAQKDSGKFVLSLLEMAKQKGFEPWQVGAIFSTYYRHGTLDAVDGVDSPEALAKLVQEGKATPAQEKAWKKLYMAREGTRRKDFEQAVRGVFGDRAEPYMEAIRTSRIAVTHATSTVGLGVGDYGKGRGSFEARSLEVMLPALHQKGVSVDEVSDFMRHMLGRRTSYHPLQEMQEGLLNTLESIHGADFFGDMKRLSEGKTPRVIGLDELTKGLVEGGDDWLWDQMMQSDDGVFLDLASKKDTVAGRKIIEDFRTKYGGSGKIYLPGAKAAKGMLGTSIKQAGGESMAVGSYFQRLLSSFAQDLQSTTTGGEPLEVLSPFFESTTRLFGDVQRNVAAGQVRGSFMGLGKVIDSKKMSHYTLQQQELMKDAMKFSEGSAIFGSFEAFFQQTKDSRGVISRVDRRKQLEAFFMGHWSDTKGRPGKAGVTVLAQRNPVITEGNLAVAQVFRDPKEVLAPGDRAWDWFKGTSEFEKLNGRFGDDMKNLRGFKDLKNTKVGGMRKAFFHHFARAIDNEWMHEGGGTYLVPKWTEKVAGVGEIDVGLGAIMFLDADGDHLNVMSLGGEQHKGIVRAMKNLNSDNYMKFKASMNAFGEESKKKLRQAGFSDDAIRSLMTQIANERATKDVGPLNNSLNVLRGAAINNMVGNETEQALSSSLVGIIQELAGMKSKKRTSYAPVADAIIAGVNELTERGDSSALRGAIKEYVIGADSAMWQKGGMQIGGFQPSGQHAYLEMGAFSIDLNRIFDFLEESVQKGGDQHKLASTGRIVASMKRDPRGTIAMLRGGVDMLGGMRRGYHMNTEEKVARDFMNAGSGIAAAAGKFARQNAGVMALGVAGAAALGSMVSPQYAPKPMEVSGQRASPEVRSAVAAGRALRPNDTRDITPQKFTPRPDGYPKPLVPGNTYMSRPNAYQIDGTIPGTGGINAAMGVVSALGSHQSTSLSVSDMRRPITSSYTDRLLGVY